MNHTMNNTLTPATQAALFQNPPPPFTLWYRPSTGRAAWEPVAHCQTEREAVGMIGTGGRRGGKWIILLTDRQP